MARPANSIFGGGGARTDEGQTTTNDLAILGMNRASMTSLQEGHTRQLTIIIIFFVIAVEPPPKSYSLFGESMSK